MLIPSMDMSSLMVHVEKIEVKKLKHIGRKMKSSMGIPPKLDLRFKISQGSRSSSPTKSLLTLKVSTKIKWL